MTFSHDFMIESDENTRLSFLILRLLTAICAAEEQPNIL